ncbi:MAG: folylpolyglutamate synthase/dihydrofolate synthase family protein [Candidatus Ancaeobacter aquaticus]|nr:folylpolyglutamate synthase/dihydrofolate synthase family protein [Candidatus Ancaeobacter aquaticus]
MAPDVKKTFSYSDACQYIYGHTDYERITLPAYKKTHYNLSRFRKLLKKIGNPHLQCKTILVAGTKGKGSTAAYIASMLHEAGYEVGFYSSPHLVTVRERIQVGVTHITKNEFAKTIHKIAAATKESNSSKKDYGTVFEILTAAAFSYFTQKKVDIAVIEVGLGGRLDATNVVKPLLSVITPIGYDHTHILGKTLAAIAREKAGIIKKNGTVVVAQQRPSALKEIIARARANNARCVDVAINTRICNVRVTPQKQWFDYNAPNMHIRKLCIGLIGSHQINNAATALHVIDYLNQTPQFSIPLYAMRKGLKNVVWSCRIEIVSKKPWVILDGAHTVNSAHHLVKTLDQAIRYKNMILVLGLSTQKDVAGIAKELCSHAETVIITCADPVRGIDPHEIEKVCRVSCPDVQIKNDPLKAFRHARSIAKAEDCICVTGSLYLAGAIKKMLDRTKR